VVAVRADAADPAAAVEAARGAAVVYHCMNPPYFTKVWAVELPRLQEALSLAAARAGARLVVLDNLYSLGDGGGRPFDEDTPFAPRSRKGEVRAKVSRALLEAHRRGDVRAVVGRASDFYGPRGELTYFGGRFWKPVLAGRPADVPFDPDVLHTYHYLEDVAAGLAALGGAPEDALGRAWMLPCQPATSTRALVDRMAEPLGRPIALRRLPPLLLKGLGLFVPILRELAEMSYQWERPFVVDDRRIRERLGIAPVEAGEAARRTVSWALQAHGAPGARKEREP
jgi:nucleoside-diphosphate-sugar epimerase